MTGPLIENRPLWGRRGDSIIDSVYLDYPSEIFWRAFIMFDRLLLGEREWEKGGTEHCFLLLIVTSRDPTAYERVGIATAISDASSD